MFITSKFMSYCPCCEKIIPAQERVWWEKGHKAIHPECKRITAESIAQEFTKKNPAFVIDFIGEVNGEYHFKASRKDGKISIHRYTTYGERIIGEAV